MARYRDAIWRPTNKHGYAGNDTHLHQGLVIHSAEGSLAGLFSVLDGSRQASWHFSVAQDGKVYQHIDTDRIAWTNGSQQANTKFWGIECEGGGPGNRGEALTEPQYQILVGVVRWLWDTHGLSVFRRQATLWEHREMTRFDAAATSCPSGRIPWTRLISDLEEDMDEATVRRIAQEEMAKPVPAPTGSAYLPYAEKLPREFAGKWPTWSVWAFAQYLVMLIGRRDAALAAHAGQPHGGGGQHDHEATVNVKLS